MLIGSRSVIIDDKTYNVNLVDCDGEFKLSVVEVESLFSYKNLFEKRFTDIVEAKIAFKDLVLAQDRDLFQNLVDFAVQ